MYQYKQAPKLYEIVNVFGRTVIEGLHAPEALLQIAADVGLGEAVAPGILGDAGDGSVSWQQASDSLPSPSAECAAPGPGATLSLLRYPPLYFYPDIHRVL
ncbi:hypothetical protein GWI33_010612 [Rhynchophorus ferrugineus]|uniref:Uncharacterized protein n=1 Tax=Rhynchophorus ferrugineus TaxID=354439 RepID=A0A834IS06_RHYFE|nr:hypothetical protein GWI33_010612 [Rhynchophorus ferrugineus]